MGRKNKNARINKPFKKIKESRAVLLRLSSIEDYIRPGIFRAAAEWQINAQINQKEKATAQG